MDELLEPRPTPDSETRGQPAEPRRASPRKGKRRTATSLRRREANRRNAQQSTGPRTAGGKARSRGNALKHGYSGAGLVLHPEDRVSLADRLQEWTEDIE